MEKIKVDNLEQVSGGSWSYGNLTSAEQSTFDRVMRDVKAAQRTGDEAQYDAAAGRMSAFLSQMDSKYGAN